MHTHTHRFSNNKIVRAYCLVLADYRSNSDQINHAVVKMLHQIAVDLKMAALLYQISALRTMQAILSEPPTTRYKVIDQKPSGTQPRPGTHRTVHTASLVPRLPPCFYLACGRERCFYRRRRGKPGNEASIQQACTQVTEQNCILSGFKQ